jgi:hypothetical protein
MALQDKHVKSGGYRKTSLYGKLGMKIERVKQISSQIKDEKDIFKPTSAEDDKAFFDSLTFDETPIFQEGGKSPSAPKLNSVESGESPIGFSENGIPLYLKGDGTIGPVENIGENNLFDLINNPSLGYFLFSIATTQARCEARHFKHRERLQKPYNKKCPALPSISLNVVKNVSISTVLRIYHSSRNRTGSSRFLRSRFPNNRQVLPGR